MRHGWPIRLGDGPVLLPVETALAEPGPGATAQRLLISGGRARILQLANQRAVAGAAPPGDAAADQGADQGADQRADPGADPGADPVLIRAGAPFDLAAARAVADPALDLLRPFKGPFLAEALAWRAAAGEALAMARIAGILPAFLVDPAPGAEPVGIALGDLGAWADPAHLILAARARLPIAHDESASILAFRSPHDTREHVALVLGEQTSDRAPLVRLHSECLTGDLFGSLKCDCGPQLAAALGAMGAQGPRGGWGVLLYLRQEGRGIGLVNKLRAYAMQDQGFDTVDANVRLGFAIDARDFSVAARMLDLIGVRSVRLLTNNPQKVAGLEAAGISVAERLPIILPTNPHNERYLATKRDRTGHQL